MKRSTRIACFALAFAGCDERNVPDPYDLDFDIPRTEAFAPSLSAYGIYEEPLASLQPAAGVVPYELSSELFTDYASKQRLLKLPEGSRIAASNNATMAFPEGTILAKTFYYPEDLREPDGPRRVIETRLLVKTDGLWNVATYQWNDEQTAATLLLGGATTAVSWTTAQGQSMAIDYEIPHEGECVTCHQSNESAVFIGPTPRNLNRSVTRSGEEVNQLAFFSAEGLLDGMDWTLAPATPDYTNTGHSLKVRARAYMDVNCAHCHNPTGWEDAEGAELDLRYQTRFGQTGITDELEDLESRLESGEMPYLGTTILHDEGVDLVMDYLSTL